MINLFLIHFTIYSIYKLFYIINAIEILYIKKYNYNEYILIISY